MKIAFGPISVCASLWLLACGGGAEPETPADVETEEATGSPSEPPAQGSDDVSSSTEETTASEPETTTSKLDPEEVLIREGTAFMLNHRESDMGKKAEAKCEQQAGDDVAKKANCLSKAINGMTREGILFDEDAGQWWYVRIGIEKGAKVEYNRVPIEVGAPAGNTITLKTTGKDKAPRRKGTVPSELKFEIPDEYTVILHHPEQGRMVFEPKMGLFNE